MGIVTKESSKELRNIPRLTAEMEAAGLDVVVATAPENTQYLSGVLIRTQISIRDRLAMVVWPREGDPTFIVCNIEESLARREGAIDDLRTYVEFAQSPIQLLIEVLSERGFRGSRIGIEYHFLTAHYFHELVDHFPAQFIEVDPLFERTRAVKTEGEVARIRDAFVKTEEAIREAWTSSHAGDSEKQVASRMIDEVTRRGADSVRHLTLASGENTIHPHGHPGERRLSPGDLVLTDFGATWGGFSSDMARMGIVGQAGPVEREEYNRYREAYVDVLHFLKPGISAADVYDYCREAFRARAIEISSPHVGHSLSRGGGHENPILHPNNQQALEPNMLIALEPIYRASATRRYHLEDLVLLTETGNQILTDWQSTEEMITIPD